MQKEDRDHYDRPSWKEIDQKKDGRGPKETRDKSASPKEMHRNKIAKKEYLKKLDRVFQGEKGSADHFELLQLLRTYQSGKRFAENIAKYVDLYGLPDDDEILLAMFELPNTELATSAVEKVASRFERISKNLKELISMKVQLLKMTLSDRKMLQLLSKIPSNE